MFLDGITVASHARLRFPLTAASLAFQNNLPIRKKLLARPSKRHKGGSFSQPTIPLPLIYFNLNFKLL
jgi:hypothetical protein